MPISWDDQRWLPQGLLLGARTIHGEEGDEGPYRTTSYLGATEVFNEYDSFLIKEIGRDEWPHHERDRRGGTLEFGTQ